MSDLREPKKLKCPICRKPVDLTGENIPFCSDRCRLIDLGKWASEEYVVSSPLQPDDLDRLYPERPDDES